jgi:UDP-2,4-diacetamido-2,4,6-trideoxy-beta-L-altropyranose hydrolase
MRVAFRVDASAESGTGHIMRCCTLADALHARGARVLFVCRHLPDSIETTLQARGHDVVRLGGIADRAERGDLEHSHWLGATQAEDAAQTLDALAGHDPDWVVIDHYGIDIRWERSIRARAAAVMVIDDLADRQHDCEVLLDQNLVEGLELRYEGRVPATCDVLLGPWYALLGPAYTGLRRSAQPRTSVRRVLIFFGGSDRENLTGRALDGVLSLGRTDIHADVVLSLNGANLVEVERVAARHATVTCYRGLPTLAPLVAAADLAIGSFGATSWERLCLGLPTLAVLMARNQREVAHALDRGGLAICMGNAENVTADTIAERLSTVLSSADIRTWSMRCMEYCDGEGTPRVIDAMERVSRGARTAAAATIRERH